MKKSLRSLYRFGSSRWQTLHLDYPVNLTPRTQPSKDQGIEQLHRIMQAELPAIQDHVQYIVDCTDALQAIRKRTDEPNALLPGWNNDFLPGLDMAALFAMVAHYKPQRYMEVGSGNSTLVAAAAKSQFSPDTEIISIDPFPRADIDQVSQQILRMPFEQVGVEWAEALEPGDMVFIDNSHRVLPNSDATVFFLEWMPRLKPGVIVQIHDIYLPWDYPQDMCERGYSEQYVLAMALMSNPQRYRTIFPAFWVHHQSELQQRLAPIWNHPNTQGVEQHGGSFWFRIEA
jgi:predicted O-methyltransferase YrrM